MAGGRSAQDALETRVVQSSALARLPDGAAAFDVGEAIEAATRLHANTPARSRSRCNADKSESDGLESMSPHGPERGAGDHVEPDPSRILGQFRRHGAAGSSRTSRQPAAPPSRLHGRRIKRSANGAVRCNWRTYDL